MCSDDIRPQYGYQLLEQVMQFLTALPVGQYLLVHRAGSASVLCYQALAEQLQNEQVQKSAFPMHCRSATTPSHPSDLCALRRCTVWSWRLTMIMCRHRTCSICTRPTSTAARRTWTLCHSCRQSGSPSTSILCRYCTLPVERTSTQHLVCVDFVD